VEVNKALVRYACMDALDRFGLDTPIPLWPCLDSIFFLNFDTVVFSFRSNRKVTRLKKFVSRFMINYVINFVLYIFNASCMDHKIRYDRS